MVVGSSSMGAQIQPLTINTMPIELSKTDGYGVAPIHGCAMFNKLNKVAGRIRKNQTIMDLLIDGAKREHKRKLALQSCNNKTEKASLLEDYWEKLTSRHLAQIFKAELPRTVQAAATIPPDPVLVEDAHGSLAIHYLPIAYLEKGNVPDSEESASFALTGMMEQIKKYDPLKGSPEKILKIRAAGAVIDWRRKVDEQTQEMRRQIKRMNQVRDELSQELMGDPTERELAEKLGWSLTQFYRVLEASLLKTISMNAVGNDGTEGGDMEIQEMIKAPNQKNPAEEAARRDAGRKFAEACAKLGDQHRKFLVVVFGEGLSRMEVANVFRVSKGRVTGIQKESFEQLRDALIELRETSGLTQNS